jgi:hypothetical protein
MESEHAAEEFVLEVAELSPVIKAGLMATYDTILAMQRLDKALQMGFEPTFEERNLVVDTTLQVMMRLKAIALKKAPD